MGTIAYQSMIPFSALRERNHISERKLAEQSGISRSTLRQMEHPQKKNVTLDSLIRLGASLDRQMVVLATTGTTDPECSTIAVSMHVMQDGMASWKIHFMNLVDEFRRNLDPALFLLPPIKSLPDNLIALLASIVAELCQEAHIDPPIWAKRQYFLPSPWFVTEMESLKALAIRDSPVSFRRNNIFVLDNFLKRA